MAGISIVLDLMRKNPNFYSSNSQTLHSHAFFSAAASAAAAAPFASRFLFGANQGLTISLRATGISSSQTSGSTVAHCDAGAALSDDYISQIRSSSINIFQHEALRYSTKEYKITLKPLFSAFEFRTFALTSLRSFVMFYLPLLEPQTNVEDDDEDFLQDNQDDRHVDLVVPFKKSVKQIFRETTVVTTRRVLERIAVHYVSQRMAWKLLKDVPKSATRKALRGMPSHVYFFCVSRTTFRGHLLGIAASWLVQVGIEVYRCLSTILNSKDESDKVDKAEQTKLLGKKVFGTTVRCSASLVFASIGGGLGATLFRPSAGQWIGCAVGDLIGPVCCEKILHVEF